MSEILTNNKYYKDIADTIRQMKGVATTYKPREMAGALREMYSTEVEGVPPLTFPSNGNNLLNYRIDGASGGVGDRTKNLWNDNITFENGTINQNTGADSSYASDYRIRSNFTDYIEPGQYTLNLAGVDRINTIALYSEKNIESFVESVVSTSGIPKTFSLQTGGYIRVALSKVNGNVVTPSEISNIQLEEGPIATDYEPYGYKIPAIISGKNLLKNTATSQTISGVTFTINSDKSITCNGTATANTVFRTVKTPDLPDNEDMLFTGCPVGGSLSTYQLQYSNNRDKAFQDMGNGIVIQKMDYNTYPNTYAQIRIMEGYTCNNLTFYPMIRLVTIEDDTYEPYIEPTTTNIYLDEPIEANESESLSDTNVNIPTINGTNILSIDTTVQPSNVYVQAPKTNNYNL